MKDLQADNQFNVAEDFQRLITACEHVKKKIELEQEHSRHIDDESKQFRDQIDILKKSCENDKETIDKQQREIGWL